MKGGRPVSADHPDLEATIGVMVPLTWDGKKYVVVEDKVAVTNGGLFSDAEEGVWLPRQQTWCNGHYWYERSRAQKYVDDLLHPVVPPG